MRLQWVEPTWQYPMTVQDRILLDEFGLKHNLMTEAKMMVRDNKDLSIEQAQKIIEDNKEVNEQSINRGLFSTLRQET